MPDPAVLTCAAQFAWKDSMLPEFDKFALFPPEEALTRMGKSLAALL